MTPTEFNPMDPALEQAVSEIHDESPDAAVVEAAAARVWERLSQASQAAPAGLHQIRGCADFQALLPDYRAGRLPAARATLLKDHLHECVACRKVYEGKVLPMPVAQTPRRAGHPVRWAAAAVIVAAAGLSVWVAVDQFGTRTGHAIVQTVNGTLYAVSAEGIRPLLAGQDLPDNVELRTAKDSDAMFQLRDGSMVELRERSGFSTTQTAGDLTIHLVRGSVIVQAAKRRTGHLYVATADCRVAVTGTIFSVSSGVKGSRVSVVQGEVHMAQDNQDKVLHAGEQAVTSTSLDPVSVKDDISWSRNHDKLIQQLNALRTSLQQIQMPALRYGSRLLGRLPADTVLYVSIPNLGEYLGEAQRVLREQMARSPELSTLWAGRIQNAEPVIEMLRTASEYLGDEIAVVGVGDVAAGGPVFLSEVKRDGFPEFLKKAAPMVTIETRPGMVAFGFAPSAVKTIAAALDAPSTFNTTPFYARISEQYRDGAGILISADLSHMPGKPLATSGARYFVANQKQVNHQMETAAAVTFDGPRTGIAAWLDEPASMGSLDYVSPDATLVTAFVVKNPGAIVDQVSGLVDQLPILKSRGDASSQTIADAGKDSDLRKDLAASLGGEFSLSLDGAPFPVPSWKLVTEVYDPERLKSSIQKLVDAHDRNVAKTGGKALRTSQETVEGHTYYTIASNDPPNPLTEVHYTFTDGYLIAGPTRALVSRALQMKVAGTSITHSAQFVALTPRDHYTNFSALVYQNLGTTLAPLVSILGALTPNAANLPQGAMQRISNMKPTMITAYGEPDGISIAGTGDILGNGLTNLLGGNLFGMMGNAVPMAQFMGTPRHQPAFK